MRVFGLCLAIACMVGFIACGTSHTESDEVFGTQHQGLACDIDGYCGPSAVCAYSSDGSPMLCRQPCNSNGTCTLSSQQCCPNYYPGAPYCSGTCF